MQSNFHLVSHLSFIVVLWDFQADFGLFNFLNINHIFQYNFRLTVLFKYSHGIQYNISICLLWTRGLKLKEFDLCIVTQLISIQGNIQTRSLQTGNPTVHPLYYLTSQYKNLDCSSTKKIFILNTNVLTLMLDVWKITELHNFW